MAKKNEPRPNIAAAIVGFKRTGKSTWLNDEAVRFNKRTGKRVLIIDVNGSPAFRKHQEITYEHFPRWRRGIKRFYDPDFERMFDYLIARYTKDNPFNGMIVFEDSWKYIDANPSKHIRTFLTDHRMINADLFFSFHSFKFIPPDFWKMLNYVIVKKTPDLLEKNKRKYEARIPNFEEIFRVYMDVKNSKNQYETKIAETGF